MLRSKEAKEIWDFLHGKEKKEEKSKQNYKVIRTTSSVPAVDDAIKTRFKQTPKNSIPTSTVSIDSLITKGEHIPEASITTTPEHKEESLRFSDLKTPELHDIVKYAQNKGIVGEEALVVTAYLALSHNIHLGVEGYSGSGKTFLTDKIIDLIPEEEIYRAELASKQAIFHDEGRINEAKILYFPELQKALQDKTAPALELIKNITEGRDAKRLVTSKNLEGSDEFIITKDKIIIYTLAKENSFKKDTELSRRIMRLVTDSSPEHFEAIHNYKANARLQLKTNGTSKDLAQRLSNHLHTLRNFSVQVIDPFAEYLQAFIPKTQKSVGYIDHYYHLVDACTRFHYQEREHFNINGQDYLLAQVQDHQYIHALYYNEFMKTLDDLAQEDEAKQEFTAPDWKDCFEQGRENLYNNEALHTIIERNPTLLKNWELRQLNQSSIYTKNYKTGELFTLTSNVELNKNDTIS